MNIRYKKTFATGWSALEKRLMPSHVWTSDPLTFWRERILFLICFIAAVLGPIALVPSLLLAYKEGLWSIILIDSLAYMITVIILIARNSSFVVRAIGFCSILYVLGIGILFILGPVGAGYIWLFGASVLISTFVGLSAAIWTLAVNTIALLSVGIFIAYGNPAWILNVDNALEKWLVMSANFILLNALITITTAFLLNGLKTALLIEQKTSKNLRESESHLRAVLESTADAILAIDHRGKVLWANARFFDLWQIPKKILHTDEDRILLEHVLTQLADPDAFLKKVQELYASEKVSFDTLDLKDGHIFERYTCALMSDGKNVGRLWSFRDITERKRAEEALQDRVKEFGCINNISRLANEPWMSIEEFVQQAVGILPSAWRYPEICAARIMLNLKEFKTANFRETQWSQSADLMVDRKKFGAVTICYLEKKPAADEGPFLTEERSLINTIADFLGHIVQHRRSEAEIRASEKKFRIIFDSANDGILLADPETKKFHFANTSICRMLGYSQEEINNIGIIDIHPEKDVPYVIEQFEKQARKEINIIPDLPVKRKDGSVFYADVSTAQVEISDKRYSVGIFRDTTERKHLEAQLRHSQKMEAVGTLAGGIAHDFNNILNVIMGYGALVMDTLGADSPAMEDMKEVLTAADRAADLTKRLLIYSRKQIVEVRSVNINELILGLEKLLARIIRESIEIDLDLADMPLIVLADAGEIEQVLINLAANARDAMLMGGRLTISTGLKEVDEEYVAAHGYGKPGRYALITVADTGQGMDAETQKKIFDPFFTTKGIGEGTGLGLAISYGIIKQHDGYINVYSEPGQGTVFKIYLPLSEEATSPDKKTDAADYVKGGNETVLVAEDDASLRKLTKTVLESFGYSVIAAEDGEDAITKFMENREHISLALLDMIMPKKSGKEVSEAIIKVAPRMKVLIASGYAMDNITNKELTESGFDFIHKPFRPKDLLIKVREVLDR